VARFRLRYSIQEFDLPEGETTIGRSEDCRITIEEVSVSRLHASVTVTPQRVMLRDLGSRNGTTVNGTRLHTEAVELRDGDHLALGTVQLTFCGVIERRARRATGQPRNCPHCGAAGLLEAPVCPSCGRVLSHAPRGELDRGKLGRGELDGRTPVVSNEQQAWYLDLQCDLLERALSLQRIAEAEAALQRVMTTVDAHVASKERSALATVERALRLSAKLSALRGETRTLAWVLEILQRMRLAPDGPLLAQLVSTPPILWREMGRPFQDFVAWLAQEGLPSGGLEAFHE
jgi:FHA domain